MALAVTRMRMSRAPYDRDEHYQDQDRVLYTSPERRQLVETSSTFNWWPYGSFTNWNSPTPGSIMPAQSASLPPGAYTWVPPTLSPTTESLATLIVEGSASSWGVLVATVPALSSPSTTSSTAVTSVSSSALIGPSSTSTTATSELFISLTALPPASSASSYPAQPRPASHSAVKKPSSTVWIAVVLGCVGIVVGVVAVFFITRYCRRRGHANQQPSVWRADTFRGGPRYEPTAQDEVDAAHIDTGIDAEKGACSPTRTYMHPAPPKGPREQISASNAASEYSWPPFPFLSTEPPPPPVPRKSIVRTRTDSMIDRLRGRYTGLGSDQPEEQPDADGAGVSLSGSARRGTRDGMRRTSAGRRAAHQSQQEADLNKQMERESMMPRSNPVSRRSSLSGFKIMREDPESGLLTDLSRASTMNTSVTNSPAMSRWARWGFHFGLSIPFLSHPEAAFEDVPEEGSIGVHESRSEMNGELDKFTRIPNRRAGSRGSLSRASTPASASARASQRPSRANSLLSTSTVHQVTVKHARSGSSHCPGNIPFPIIESPRPETPMRIDSTVLPRGPSQVSSPPLERALSFGAAPSPPSTPTRRPDTNNNQAHVSMPGQVDEHWSLIRDLNLIDDDDNDERMYERTSERRAGREHGRDMSSRANEDAQARARKRASSPAQRYAARRDAHAKVEAILSRSWSTRDVPSSPTMFGAHGGGEEDEGLMHGYGIEQRLQGMKADDACVRDDATGDRRDLPRGAGPV